MNYVDFGNSEVLSLSAIRLEIPFIEVPQQCLQLVLRGIEPVRFEILYFFFTLILASYPDIFLVRLKIKPHQRFREKPREDVLRG